MDEPICFGFAVLKRSKLHMFETNYDNLHPYFGQESFQLQYVDTDAFVLSMNTKDIIRDLIDLEDVFDFSNLDKNYEIFSEKKNKTVIGFFVIETPKNIWVDEFGCKKK